MAIAAVKIKIMPTSPDVDLKELEFNVVAVLNENEAKNASVTQEPIAFGLVALILFFGWDESKELELLETELAEVDNVNSVEVIDMRRAFG